MNAQSSLNDKQLRTETTIISIVHEAITEEFEGNLEHAENLFKVALGMRGNIYGKDHPHLIPLLEDVARVTKNRGNLKESKLYHDKAIALEEADTSD